jgi:hypothetical protein
MEEVFTQIDNPNKVKLSIIKQKLAEKAIKEKAESSKKKNKISNKTNALYSKSQRLTFIGRSAAKISRELGINEHIAQIWW